MFTTADDYRQLCNNDSDKKCCASHDYSPSVTEFHPRVEFVLKTDRATAAHSAQQRSHGT